MYNLTMAFLFNLFWMRTLCPLAGYGFNGCVLVVSALQLFS